MRWVKSERVKVREGRERMKHVSSGEGRSWKAKGVESDGFILWNSPPIGAAKLQDTPTAHAAANSSLL